MNSKKGSIAIADVIDVARPTLCSASLENDQQQQQQQQKLINVVEQKKRASFIESCNNLINIVGNSVPQTSAAPVVAQVRTIFKCSAFDLQIVFLNAAKFNINAFFALQFR